jgi:hypothetical protein
MSLSRKAVTMLPETTVIVTKHALERFIERTGQVVDAQRLVQIVKRAVPLGKSLRKRVRRYYRARFGYHDFRKENFAYSVDLALNIVFVLACDGVGRFVLVTCMPINRKVPGKKAASQQPTPSVERRLVDGLERLADYLEQEEPH